ncbi:YjbH domain-containing protein [Polynucleobacter sphagniphilus]|uniref:YjbH domain-containing protein n=1 Tax=Polynucleobacter sphagniphilus TaxID=1743169 RepID=UPI002474C03D|nr:YjbH domain-containing protein [Polynucleobacter sphagniphilus]MDH6525134.1 hypothetical protein [Polynucleobacter sphagniphilus]
MTSSFLDQLVKWLVTLVRRSSFSLGLQFLTILVGLTVLHVQAQTEPAIERVSVSAIADIPSIQSGERLSDWLLRARPAQDSLDQQQTPKGNPQSPYFLGSSWLTPKEIPDQIKAKQALLEGLDKIPFPENDSSAQLTKARLYQWIETMPVTGRVVLPNTNPRALQANPKQDPILLANEKVIIPQTPQTVTVIRANGTLCKIAYRPHVEARFYIQGCTQKGKEVSPHADWASIIEPDGSVHVVPVAAWNAGKQDFPAPGSWIWAPPRNSLWTSTEGEQFSKQFTGYLSTQGPSGFPQGAGENQGEVAYLPRVGPREIYEASRDLPISSNFWGETGFIQVPSARVAPAGTGSVTFASWQPYGTLNLAFSPLDWMEFALRYTNVNNVAYGSQAVAGGQTYKDKSAGVKLRLWEESAYLPQFALGIRDAVGAGLFSSEYAVASKRYSVFDFSLGLGWGQLGTRNNITNPMKIFGSSFGTRPEGTVGQGGTVNTGALFHGTSAVIGGLQYHTPWDPLVLKLELDGNSYQQTPQVDLPFGQNLATKTMFNLGAVYQGSFWDFTAALRGGNQVMLGLSLHDRIDLLSTPKVAQAKPVVIDLKPVGDYDPSVPVVLARNTGNPSGVLVSPGKALDNSILGSANQAIANQAIKAQLGTSAAVPSALNLKNESASQIKLQSSVGGSSINSDALLSSSDINFTLALSDKQNLIDQYRKTLLDFEAQTQWKASSLNANGDTWIINLSDSSGIFIRSRLNRGIAILHRDAPSQIQFFEIYLNNWGMLVSQYRINRKDWMLAETQLLPPSEKHPNIIAQEPTAYTTAWGNRSLPVAFADEPSPISQSNLAGPSVGYLDHDPLQTNLGVSYSQVIGGPNAPFLFSLGVMGDALYKFRDNTWVTGTINARVLDNFGKYTYQPPPDGLYPVRTDIRQFMTNSLVTMPNLQVTNTGQLSGNQFVSVYAGYLEMMFAGAGGEYLWRPVDSRLAIGANINRVYQRQFNQWTSLQNYSVNTGFVTAYWDTGVQDLLVKLSVGQYLAGDRGGTLDVSRVFQNGVKIGAYATRTNVSYAAFGEGSFDKGLYIMVPFDAFFARHSDSVANMVFTPLIRDGGAMLFRKYQLYDMTRTRDDRALLLGPD